MHRTDARRYDRMTYARCGKSGLRLPRISLGLWHNFGEVDSEATARQILCTAFDWGMTHFDLANNYGPPPGAAEEMMGRVLRKDLSGYRDELVISTKAGYTMWPGPYGEGGSRKYLLSSLDQSLKRMGLEYVDIFYSHRFDPETPLEETLSALVDAVRWGKALYVGISNYPPEATRKAAAFLRASGVPCLIHQMKYSLLVREPEAGLFEVLLEEGIGGIAFSPLAQGLLTDRYLEGIPEDSRAAKPHGFLKPEEVTDTLRTRIRALYEIARRRGQTLAQMALLWVLRHPAITSVLIGVSSVSQLEDNLKVLHAPSFTSEELTKIEAVLSQ